MKLRFTKMHGAGNDFVVFDGIHQHLDMTPEQWRHIADRRFGIGADQILVVEKPQRPDVDFRYRIYNADGGEVEQCGNGARAFVRFVTEKKLTDKNAIRVETMSGIIEPRLEADGSITVNMGSPVFSLPDIPFDNSDLHGRTEGQDTLWPLKIEQDIYWLSVVSMGNPHAVHIASAIETAPVAQHGALIERHPRFARRVNVGFMQIRDAHTIDLRVFERGSGETFACGTGACAAVVCGIRRGRLLSPVTVHARGGDLTIAWEGAEAPVLMTGPAVSVFEGEIEL